MIVRFLLICEGLSDHVLVSHIQQLLIQYGAADADNIFSHFGTSLTEKVKYGLELSAAPGLLLVHRDAEHHREGHAKGTENRYTEVKDSAVVEDANSADFIDGYSDGIRFSRISFKAIFAFNFISYIGNAFT